MSSSKRLMKKKTGSGSRRRGVLRTPTQQTEYPFIRYMNVANAAGTTVDGSTLAKATNLNVVTSGTLFGITYGTLSFYVQLSDLPDYSDFTALFDQYRVDSVELILQPYCTNVATGAAYSASSAQSGILVHSVVDYDDAALPTGSDAGIQALREYQNYRVESLFNGTATPLIRKWQPRISSAVYGGIATTGYRSGPFDWVDCASTSVQGYGYKCIMEVVSTGIAATYLVKAEARVHLRFRNVR